ncbi:MAG: LL-diaminopimelate aminotransferase [Muribaculaceae bacterium]|nr:LL-diaminopimelate aminotransferase [Muribaculaceae bacterium]MDE5713153.1 LL-diaminopimelate aminotransferase [Muribaculaceae bacterium]
MIQVNDRFRQLPESYLFSEVARRVAAYKKNNAGVEIIRMDIGDVTQPLFDSVVEAMHAAVDDLACPASFHGYGPEQGYSFLRDAISRHDYHDRGLGIDPADIFVSDGAKSDLGNLGDIYSRDCKVAVMNPSYPVYVDDSVIDGRAGEIVDGIWNGLVYLDCDPDNNFMPSLPKEKVDVIFLCFPNNPTGEAITRNELAKWVSYAQEKGSLIIYDSAYEAFVREPDKVRSIYEIEGADEVAIEVRSFSKTAGFTGIRCGYTVVPRKLKGRYADGTEVSLNMLWNRRQCTKFNGASYVAQRGAAAIYTPEGLADVRKVTDYYIGNAAIIKDAFSRIGFNAYGGDNSPYVWVSAGVGKDSWQIFEAVLHACGFSTTPGSGFGTKGEGYIRLTGFNSRENTEIAMSRLIDSGIGL